MPHVNAPAEITLLAESARINKLVINKTKGDDKPVMLSMGVDTGPIELAQLDFMIPPGEPFHFWSSDGIVDDNAPTVMNMKYKTRTHHSGMIDDVVDFIGHRFNGFTAKPADDFKLLLNFTVKIVEPEQNLITKLSQRVMDPIRFEIIGEIPEPQGELDL